jgi:hypothetical protein
MPDSNPIGRADKIAPILTFVYIKEQWRLKRITYTETVHISGTEKYILLVV